MAGTPEYELLNRNFAMVDGHAVKAPEDYQDPEQLYQALIERVRKYHPSADISLIEKAYKSKMKHITDRCANQASRISSIRSGWDHLCGSGDGQRDDRGGNAA